MICVETRVRIERPIEDVYTYVSDPDNFPHWNSAVQAVRRTSTGNDTIVGSTYLMERNLPGGRAVNELESVSYERPTEFAVRTTSRPTPFLYRFRLAPDDGATMVRIQAEVELGGVADLLAPIARLAIRRGVDENLATLKRVLETDASLPHSHISPADDGT